jgi:hypothetical protein
MGLMKSVYTTHGKVKGAKLVKEGVEIATKPPKRKPATEPPSLFKMEPRKKESP